MTRIASIAAAFAGGVGLGVTIAAMAAGPSVTAVLVREWVAALSGWAAAGVGGYTLLLLLRQLKFQRSQTDFAVGDTEPEIDFVRHFHDEGEVVVTIRNWNRRNILISDIQISGVEGRTGIVNALLNNNDFKCPSFPPFKIPIRIKGLMDRSAKPQTIRFHMVAMHKDGKPEVEWSGPIHVEAKIMLVSNEIVTKILQARLLVIGN